MPIFGKARKYNVSSRNAYLVCVNMLDNHLIECTLTADGTGHDCLQNIAQRIHLNEIYYFGLQYVNKKLQFRWLDLDRPLKKQLDKSAHSPLLYFRVMFYVADVQSINDETTRYQYYLQLKLSVIDGKLPCTHKQAILLGAYCLQAEFGDHDPMKHTVDALRDQLLLPRNMCSENSTVMRLLSEMLQLHHGLQGVTRDVAEMHYILEAQQLEGYGLDYFPAKDTNGREILLGASFIGIFVKDLNGQPANYFKWSDINNLAHTKRNFNIETTLTEKKVHFHMDDPDMVKYVFKMCSLQHKFYHTKQHSVTGPSVSVTPSPVVPHHHETSQYNEMSVDRNIGSSGPLPDIQQSVQIYDKTEKQQPENLPTPDENMYENTQAILEQEYSPSPPQEDQYVPESSSSSYPPSPQHSNSSMPPVRVPSYRPAPDYETIMRQRMDYMAVQQQQERTLHLPNIGRAQVYAQPEILAYSQPEMRMQQHHHMGGNMLQHHSHYPQTMQLSDVDNPPSNTRVFPVSVDRAHSLIIQPTYSTPELYRMSTAPQSVHENNLSPMMSYKLPPPYPRSSSNSYPDLAMQGPSSPSYNSPDLVSRKNLNNTQLLVQSRLDKSMDHLDNLPLDIQQQQLQQHQLRHNQHLQQQQQQQQQIHRSQQLGNEASTSGSRHEIQFCTPAPPLPVVKKDNKQKTEEKEVFIMDPPNPVSSSIPSQFIVPPHKPLSLSRSNPFDHYGSENPYENLPPAYVHPDIPLHPPVVGLYQNVDEVDDGKGEDDVDDVDGQEEEEIQCLDTSKFSESAHHHQASDSVVSNATSTLSTGSSNDPNFQTEEENRPTRQAQISVSVDVEADSLTADTSERELEVDVQVQDQSSTLDSSAHDQSTASRAPTDERRNLLEAKLTEGQVFAEFEVIPKKRLNSICAVGERAENTLFNRFKDILPYDDTRVEITKTKNNPTGYVNASHIKLKLKARNMHYIAGQGPLELTVSDFWQMIWEQNIHVITMLTGLEEGGKHKCFSYWPGTRGPKNKLKFGDFEVYTKLTQNSGSYVTSRLVITHKKLKKERQIWHLQYVGWPDHGCPEDTFGFQCYLEEVEAVSRQLESDKIESPMFVHCSAGVGRSGVLILTHFMRRCLDLNQDVLIPAVLEKMRAQRMHMVQTVTQYTFVYYCLVDYLNNVRLI